MATRHRRRTTPRPTVESHSRAEIRVPCLLPCPFSDGNAGRQSYDACDAPHIAHHPSVVGHTPVVTRITHPAPIKSGGCHASAWGRSGRLGCLLCLSLMVANRVVHVCAVVNLTSAARGIFFIKSLSPRSRAKPSGTASSVVVAPEWRRDCDVPVFVSGCSQQCSAVGGQLAQRGARLGGRT
jgi:hypothetical protein